MVPCASSPFSTRRRCSRPIVDQRFTKSEITFCANSASLREVTKGACVATPRGTCHRIMRSEEVRNWHSGSRHPVTSWVTRQARDHHHATLLRTKMHTQRRNREDVKDTGRHPQGRISRHDEEYGVISGASAEHHLLIIEPLRV